MIEKRFVLGDLDLVPLEHHENFVILEGVRVEEGMVGILNVKLVNLSWDIICKVDLCSWLNFTGSLTPHFYKYLICLILYFYSIKIY